MTTTTAPSCWTSASPSCWSRALTSTGHRLFTPEFAAPEQIRGDPVTTSVDIHALGLLLCTLLAILQPAERDLATCMTRLGEDAAAVLSAIDARDSLFAKLNPHSRSRWDTLRTLTAAPH